MFEEGLAASAETGSPVSQLLTRLADEEQPGPTAIAALGQVDPAGLTVAQLTDLLVAYERQLSWVAAQQARVLVAMQSASDLAAGSATGDGADPRDPAVPFGRSERDDWLRVEVALALRMSDGAADLRLRVARALDRRLPGTAALLAAGRIGYWHAVAVAEATAELDPALLSAAERRILRRADTQSVAELRRTARRAVIAADPARAQAAHDEAAAGRTVRWWALPDGMGELRAILPAAGLLTVTGTLTSLAGLAGPHDERGIDARRADALVDLFARVGAGDAPHTPASRPCIQVTVAASTVLGLDEQPAELAGYGPITSDTARRIAADGTWRRLLYDPDTGSLLDYGRRIYRPPADLTRYIHARDQVCTFPQCTRSARRCDIDHATAWNRGGKTNPHNCHALCRRHHRAKTHGGWRLTRHPNGINSWTSPAGKTYDTRPPSYADP